MILAERVFEPCGRRLTKTSLTVTGGWTSQRQRDPTRQTNKRITWGWSGQVTAAVPLAVVLFLEQDRALEWIKLPSVDGAAELLVDFQLRSSGDQRNSLDVVWGRPGQVLRTTLGMSADDLLNTVTCLTESLPERYTATAIPMLEVGPVADVVCGAVVLHQQDVQLGSDGIWRVPAPLVEGLPPMLTQILTTGPTGRVTVQDVRP